MARHKRPSGKPKRKSHGAQRLNRATASNGAPRILPPMPTNLGVPAQLPRPDTSARYSITVVYDFAADDPLSQVQRSPEGSPGTYRITFVLSLPGKEMYRGDLSFQEIMQSGDSLLKLHPSVMHCNIKLVGEGEVVDIVGFPNTLHAMSRLQMRVTAPNFVDAARCAHDLIVPLLSRWSYESDEAGVMSTDTWTVASAKEKFREVMDRARSDGPQTVMWKGRPAVVIVAVEEWERKTRRTGNLAGWFAASPLRKSDLCVERLKDSPREIEL